MGGGDLRFEAACNEAFYCDGDVTYIVIYYIFMYVSQKCVPLVFSPTSRFSPV